MDEKQSLRQRLKELEGGLCNLKELQKQISHSKNILMEKDKIITKKRGTIDPFRVNHQLKYDKGISLGLESALELLKQRQ